MVSIMWSVSTIDCLLARLIAFSVQGAQQIGPE